MNINKLINRIKSGELTIAVTDSESGYYIFDPEGDEGYSVLPYDDDPNQGYYIFSEGADEPISLEDVEQLNSLV